MFPGEVWRDLRPSRPPQRGVAPTPQLKVYSSQKRCLSLRESLTIRDSPIARMSQLAKRNLLTAGVIILAGEKRSRHSFM